MAWSAGASIERYGSGGPDAASHYYSRWNGSAWSTPIPNTGRQVALRGNVAYLVWC